MAKKILWVGPAYPGASQVEALRTAFGPDTEVIQKNIWNAEEVQEEFKRGGYEDVVVLAPIAALAAICWLGLTPLWSEAVREDDPSRVEFRGGNGQGYRFDRFRRLLDVKLNLALPAKNVCVRRIVRYTRHQLAPDEAEALRELFPNAELHDDPRPFRNGREILQRAQQAGADEISVVAPWSVYDQLVRAGTKPFYTEMSRGRFVAIYRIHGMETVFLD